MIIRAPGICSPSKLVLMLLCATLLQIMSPAHVQAQSTEQAGTAAENTDTASQEVPVPAQLPQHIPTLKVLALETFANNQLHDFVRILEHARTLRPDDPDLMAQLVIGYGQLDQKAAAYTIMIQMQRQGISYDFDAIPQSEPLRGTQVYDHLNKLLKNAAQAYGAADMAFTLPKTAIMPETLAWDAKSDHFFVGTVREGEILRLNRAGEAQQPAIDTEGLFAIFGLAVDSQRNRLWVSTTAVGQWRPYREQDYGRAELVSFDLSTGKRLNSYRLIPDGKPHGFGNLSIAADGSVFVADSRQPMVHVLRPGSDEIKALFISTEFTSIRGLAMNDEDGLLYIADRELGIAMWSENDQQLYRLHKPETLNLSGLEGINYWNHHLIAIQNGINPSRVIQIRLEDNGRGIVQEAPLVAALDSFDGPSYGAIAGNQLFFFAANHWPAFDIKGQRLPGTHVNPVPVLSIALSPLEGNRFPKQGIGQPGAPRTNAPSHTAPPAPDAAAVQEKKN